MKAFRILTVLLVATGLLVTGAIAATRPERGTIDRGTITAVSATSLTLERRTGGSVTFALTPATRLRGSLVVGARASVVSRDGTALRVAAKTRGTATKPRGERREQGARGPFAGAVHIEYRVTRADGSVRVLALDKGKVTAFTETSITLRRRDDVSVSFTRDAATRVRGTLAVDARAAVLSEAGKALAVRVAGAKRP